ncbi:hypothetical protein SDC9_191902 [bioreactor metagenome]|uniref:Uncharacterized protein n=1 Tax=bioreactor metagenome TaxID=1076179 RepID=A0A645HZA6_9ZZZZ
MKQVHEGKTQQVGRQGLLHFYGGCAQCLGNAREGGNIGVNRERAQHAENGKQHGQSPTRSAPERGEVVLHSESWVGKYCPGMSA